jgi:hypothetical protein
MNLDRNKRASFVSFQTALLTWFLQCKSNWRRATKISKLPQILNEHLNLACNVWTQDKLTCRMLCNEHADHDQEDKQDSESLHYSSCWFLPQDTLQVMELVLMTALLFVTCATRNSFMVTHLPPKSSDIFPPCPLTSDNFPSREDNLITAEYRFSLLTWGWSRGKPLGDRGIARMLSVSGTAINSQGIAAKRTFTSGIFLVY